MNNSIKKDWRTTVIGALYAMIILALTQFTTGAIDFVTIIEAGAGILFGLKAADNVKAQSAYEHLIVHWKTTLIALFTATGALLYTYYQASEPITSLVIFKAFGLSLLGIISKDSNPSNANSKN